MKHWITVTPIGADGVFDDNRYDVDQHETKDNALAFAEEVLMRDEHPMTLVYIARVEHTITVEHKVRVEGVA